MKPRVLIVCTGNSCRSQMAEGLLRHFSKGQFEVESAGTHPSFVHPLSIKVMKEIGIDISHHTSKSVEQFIDEQFDYVITVCDSARESCPYFPNAKKRLHIPFEDPVTSWGDEEKRMDKFREVRDQIKEKIQELSPRLQSGD